MIFPYVEVRDEWVVLVELFAELDLDLRTTIKHDLFREVWIVHPSAHSIVLLLQEVFLVQLVREDVDIVLTLLADYRLELLLQVRWVTVVGAEAVETFSFCQSEFIERGSPVYVFSVYLIELIPVLEQVDVDIVIVSHAEAIAVQVDRFSFCREAVVVKFVEPEFTTRIPIN